MHIDGKSVLPFIIDFFYGQWMKELKQFIHFIKTLVIENYIASMASVNTVYFIDNLT